MQVLAVIPVRYQSTRLPGKPLLKAGGKYLFQHVYEKVCQASKVDKIVIATDDDRIMKACQEIGAEGMMTSDNHPSGTDRVAEVAQKYDAEIVLNIQGDEPEIPPQAINKLAELLIDDKSAEMATLACKINSMDLRNNFAQVKVVIDNNNNALYFSRQAIPFFRDDTDTTEILNLTYGHVGVYGYQRNFLLKFSSLPLGKLEIAEKLEQLRALENGAKIKVGLIDWSGKGIDTPEDYDKFIKTIK